MVAVGKIVAIALDSADPAGLARFYRELLDLPVRYESPEFVCLQGEGVMLTFEYVADHRPPVWPGVEVPKQMHLDIEVDDLDEAERRAIEIGAVKADFQPKPESWRVLLDPAGHPFCVVAPIPAHS
ncbi:MULTISPECIES: VOC family protein [unclassified Nocardia]|uniref:VOC family protein n=1 Tax=unclassified Nocardia TaxID=2637762 RepID=UPI001CE456FA|nr:MULTISPECIES: VOC family protein [unclassified Nocardia]